jgi:hypothetical protein
MLKNCVLLEGNDVFKKSYFKQHERELRYQTSSSAVIRIVVLLVLCTPILKRLLLYIQKNG